MFGIGMQELIVILVVALLVFGPTRLPELARSLGRGLAEFRRASSDLRQSLLEATEEPRVAARRPPAAPQAPEAVAGSEAPESERGPDRQAQPTPDGGEAGAGPEPSTRSEPA